MSPSAAAYQMRTSMWLIRTPPARSWPSMWFRPLRPIPPETNTRPLALLEMMSEFHDGPAEAVLGNVDAGGTPVHKMWADPISENPNVGDTELWEFYNFTAD